MVSNINPHPYSKDKVKSQNDQLETLHEEADAAIGVAQDKMDERISKLKKDAGYTAAGTVVGVIGNAAMLNPIGAVQELFVGTKKGYEQVTEVGRCKLDPDLKAHGFKSSTQ